MRVREPQLQGAHPPALGGLCRCSPQPVRRLRQLAKDVAMGAGEPFQPGPESIHHLIYLTALSPPLPARLCRPGGSNWARVQLCQNLKSHQ